ncbi:MAG: hypothetical protein P3X22_007045 [Thermoprotei archaeon]|nr:hypothetical protein [Thermoprotei archaeon]
MNNIGKTEEAPSLTILIKSIARTMATPYKTGVYISIVDLIEIAKKTQLPVTIKESREWVLEELLKTAVDYDKMENVIEELKTMIESKINEFKNSSKTIPKPQTCTRNTSKTRTEH